MTTPETGALLRVLAFAHDLGDDTATINDLTTQQLSALIDRLQAVQARRGHEPAPDQIDPSFVVCRRGLAYVAAGPLAPHEDPVTVLRTKGNHHHQAWALLDMRWHPDDSRRKFTRNHAGQISAVVADATTAIW